MSNLLLTAAPIYEKQKPLYAESKYPSKPVTLADKKKLSSANCSRGNNAKIQKVIRRIHEQTDINNNDNDGEEEEEEEATPSETNTEPLYTEGISSPTTNSQNSNSNSNLTEGFAPFHDYREAPPLARIDTTAIELNRQTELMQKIDYLIHMIEENKHEKTNYVTEEIVMYSFLGIFVIFVVDNFVRVGKYVR
tara:strand:- start:542 stop:1120 length:579 start_codon:yes stop_codon:yes gene_type:complete